MSRDPRVEALSAWAGEGTERRHEAAFAAIEALLDAPPSPACAAELAGVAAVAYAPPRRHGWGTVWIANRVVAVLAQLGEPGARELVRLRDTVRYRNDLGRIETALGQLTRELGVPAGELEDSFAGVAVDSSLSARVPVGRYVAIIRVADDLRRVQTSWADDSGKPLSRRPAAVAQLADELAAVENVRRRLRAHVTALRDQLEQGDGQRTPVDDGGMGDANVRRPATGRHGQTNDLADRAHDTHARSPHRTRTQRRR